MGTGIWNSWGWHWGPYERGTREILLENLVENDWKPYQEAYQLPCWEPQIRNPFTNPKNWQPSWAGRLLWTTFGTEREFFQNRDCCEPHSELNGSFSKTFCWELYQEPYRLFGNHIAKPIGNLSTTSAPKPCIGTLLGTLNLEPYTGTLSETLSGTLKPLFGTLLGTWNLRPEIGNWLGTLLGTGRNPAESCPDMPQNIY